MDFKTTKKVMTNIFINLELEGKITNSQYERAIRNLEKVGNLTLLTTIFQNLIWD